MKQQQKLLLLAVWLLALPLQLWAQDKKPFFNLKKGDWFVYQVDINSGIQFPPHPPQPVAYKLLMMGDKFKHQYTLKFIFEKQLPTNNQEFKVVLERVKFKRLSSGETWLGYDSNYPEFSQAKGDAVSEFVYKLEISPNGEIVTLLPQALDYLIPLQEISPKKKLGYYTSMMVNPLPMEILKLITDFITIPHQANENKVITNSGGLNLIGNSNLNVKVASVTESPLNLNAKVMIGTKEVIVPFGKENLIPGMINLQGLSMLLTKASFLVPANTVVKGRILNTDKGKKNVVTVNNQEFELGKDGTFTCPLFKENPGEGFFRYSGYGSTFFHTFLTPGDTLVVEADGTNFQQSLKLSGSAAPDTRLAMEAQKVFEKQDPNYFSNNLKSGNTADFIKLQEKGKQEFNELIKAYSNKASTTAIDYFKTEWTFLMAEAKLFFLYNNQYRSSPTAEVALHGFPQDFFLSIDTLPVVMNDFVGGWHYNNYFEWYLPFQEARVGMASGGQIGFLSRYSIALASLKQYPLYKVLAEELEDEIKTKSWQQNQRMKPYYEDYIANCRDTFFTKPLVKLWQRNESWAPGSASPVKTLTLADGSVFDLTKFKGKAVCLIVNNHNTDKLEGLKKHIIASNPEEIQYVIIQVNQPYKKEPINSQVLKLPNVSYLEMNYLGNELEKLGVGTYETSIFIFDKWLRVIDNNIRLHPGVEQQLDAPIQKAIEAKRFSKEQKAQLIQIGGWSLGSILLAVIVGLFIYRNRLRTIRQQELVKRQMQELEIKAIRSQMNPHFVFNALNSIQSLITSSQFREANIYLSKFATLLRSVLHNSEKNMVPLSDELEAVKLYCQLEQLRFDFAFELLVDEAINPNLIEIPPMIIQPLVENAIVHGLAPKGNEGKLQIHISLVQGQLQVLVTDNGAGIINGRPDKLSQKGFGLKLVQERINILSHEDKKASLSLQSAPAGEAKKTTSLLTIPID